MSEVEPLIITRIFDAPREVVWAAWTEPDRITEWSCPQTFVITYAEGDLRVGGKWRSGMKSEAMGYEGKLVGEYLEIDPPSHLKFTHSWEAGFGDPTNVTTITVDLKEIDGKTEMSFVQTGFDSVESRDGHEGGWNESFDKLGTLLEGSS